MLFSNFDQTGILSSSEGELRANVCVHAYAQVYVYLLVCGE